MRKQYLTSRGILLQPAMPMEDLLRALVIDYETAGRFILDWAELDLAVTTDYLAKFLAKVHRELNTTGLGYDGHYLAPWPGVRTSFGNQRPSVSFVAFHRFCELLYERPQLVSAVQTHPEYARTLGFRDFFGGREQNPFAIERSHGWRPRQINFGNPDPLSEAGRALYMEEMRQKQVRYEEAQVREKEARARKQAAIGARRKAIPLRLVEERRKSDLKKSFRDSIFELPAAEQVQRLAWDETYSIRVFPVDTKKFTLEVLRQVDQATRDQLLRRIESRWEPFWKLLAQRIRAVSEE